MVVYKYTDEAKKKGKRPVLKCLLKRDSQKIFPKKNKDSDQETVGLGVCLFSSFRQCIYRQPTAKSFDTVVLLDQVNHPM